MIEVKNIDELIGRLIDNEFTFNIKDNKLIFESPESKELDNSVLGLHYYGNVKNYYFVLDDYDVSDIIYKAFNLYKMSIAKAFRRKMNKILEELECHD